MDVSIVPMELYASILDAVLALLIAGILLACLCQSCNVSCRRMVSYIWLKFSTRAVKFWTRAVASKPATRIVALVVWISALAKIPSIS